MYRRHLKQKTNPLKTLLSPKYNQTLNIQKKENMENIPKVERDKTGTNKDRFIRIITN